MASAFKLIVGLGNPGPDYEKTRHNAGFWLIKMLASAEFVLNKRFKALIAETMIDSRKVIFALPQTYMNLSGESVIALMNFYKISLNEVLVAHDELDLSPGLIRLKNGGGHGGHNGLKSIIAHCGGNDFWRVRIGIGHPGFANLVANYVLKPPSKSEYEEIINALNDMLRFERDLYQGELDAVMNVLHQKKK